MLEDIDNVNLMMDSMMLELESDKRFLPSEFWKDINKKNIDMIVSEGLSNFKRTVSQNYYNWLITRVIDPQFRRAVLFWLVKPSFDPIKVKIERNIRLRYTTRHDTVVLSWLDRFIYKIFVSLTWQKMLEHDRHKLSQKLSEPEIGNPIKIWKDGKLITQDLANSVIECNTIVDAVGHLESPKIAELGAGSGRLAHAFMSTQSGKYMIFDIPPALIISQWYLKQVFPNKKIFMFRQFDSFENIREELNSCDVAFFAANQLAQFPEDYFDLILSISTLPEMHPDQVAMYLDFFGKLSSKFLYLKQWIKWYNPRDNAEYGIDDFQFDEKWRLVSDNVDPINPRFFNRVWKKVQNGSDIENFPQS